MCAIQSLVILGGGSSGWMAASLLAKRLGQSVKITLVESADIGIIGVGEATIPWIKTFIDEIGLEEQEFIRTTNASFKLGIEFVDWHKPGSHYFHPFAPQFDPLQQIPFHQYWTKLRKAGDAAPLDNYFLSAQMARAGKFALPKKGHNGPNSSRFNYAFHFDAALFAQALAKKACSLGVNRIQGTVTKVKQDSATGDIQSLLMRDGQEISGDFFIDCSGFDGLLIERTLHSGFEDWSHWLPCNGAVAVPCSSPAGELPAYTRCSAQTAGWQWQIPLQNRVGNGYVFCSDFISEGQATQTLLDNLPGAPLQHPKSIRFTTGVRKKMWNRNVFALGLASGFLEPLESTSIYLVQSCLEIFYRHLPGPGSNHEKLAEHANCLIHTNMAQLRDFIIAHYHLNQRKGDPFWNHCREMPIPDSLAKRLEQFRHTATLDIDEAEFFKMSSWLAIFSGYDFLSNHWHPRVDQLDSTLLKEELSAVHQGIQQALIPVADHREFIRQILAARSLSTACN